MSEIAQQALVAYTQALIANPLRTKMLTSGSLAALAEVLAGKFAGVAPTTKELPPAPVSQEKAVEQQPLRYIKALLAVAGINDRVAQMFVYGFCISAPLGHLMTGVLQRAFAGKTTTRDKIQQIITANLTTAVLSNTVYIISMAYINGARSTDKIKAAVKANLGFLMKVTWVTSPITIGVAQKFLPPQLWEPYVKRKRVRKCKDD
jgi:peroxisomal membrane protein 2